MSNNPLEPIINVAFNLLGAFASINWWWVLLVCMLVLLGVFCVGCGVGAYLW